MILTKEIGREEGPGQILTRVCEEIARKQEKNQPRLQFISRKAECQ